MKTLTKKKLYKFCKDNYACSSGLKRLRDTLRSRRTAVQIIEFYEKCSREYWTHSNRNGEGHRGLDYRWMCSALELWWYDDHPAPGLARMIARTK